MQNFDWNLIRSFLAALEGGSLASASRQTGISQPTLGRHIDELEASFGVILFERGRKGMLPTEVAFKLASAARDMQQAGNALEMAASGSSQAIEGTVRITASDIVATYILPSLLAEMLHDLPQIQIELVPSNTVENLLERDADIAVRMVRPTQNDLIARQVNSMEMGAFADETYLDTSGPLESFDDLSLHVLIGYDRDTLIIRGFAKAGFKVDRNFFRFRCDSQVTAFEALVAGVGVGFAPRAIASRFSNLIPVLGEFKIPPLPMWLTSHRELRTSAKIRLVNDYLASKIENLDLD